MTVIGLHIHSGTDTTASRNRKSTSHAKQIGFVLGFHFDIFAISIIRTFSHGGIGGLVDFIHCHGAGTSKLRCPTSGTNGYGFGRTITIGIRGTAIICIVCFYSDTIGRNGVLFLCIPGQRSIDMGIIDHDCNSCTSGIFPESAATNAQCSGAMVACFDRKRSRLHFLVI